jgi:hypothetical protein
MSATITAYAYETVANKIIEAGIGGAASAIESAAQNQISQPARPSLGMLASALTACRCGDAKKPCLGYRKSPRQCEQTVVQRH